MKPSLSIDEHLQLFADRGLVVQDEGECRAFLRANSYYRFSGYARYFQKAPHYGDNAFRDGATFDEIRAVYEADEKLRNLLLSRLGRAEVLLRTRVGEVIGRESGPYGSYLRDDFYFETNESSTTVEAVLRDIERSADRHILRYKSSDVESERFSKLPIWSAVEAYSFGTLSKTVERGAVGALSERVAESLGVAKGGFTSRAKALVYLRNRCAHHARLWNHSVMDAGATPNNVRKKAKRKAGQFGPRSVLDVVASLDDLLERGCDMVPLLDEMVVDFAPNSEFWGGLSAPRKPRDSDRQA